jgi:hypothetical protein
VIKKKQGGVGIKDLADRRVTEPEWWPHRVSGMGSFSQREPLMRGVLLAFAVVAVMGWMGTAQAQTQTVERSVKTVPNKDTQIGVYLNVLPDCSSGPLPTIRLATPPASGKVVVKTAKVKATNYKACLALEVPAYVAFYKSPPEFLGNDVLTIEVKYPGGRTEIQKITVNVAGIGAQQKI